MKRYQEFDELNKIELNTSPPVDFQQITSGASNSLDLLHGAAVFLHVAMNSKTSKHGYFMYAGSIKIIPHHISGIHIF